MWAAAVAHQRCWQACNQFDWQQRGECRGATHGPGGCCPPGVGGSVVYCRAGSHHCLKVPCRLQASSASLVREAACTLHLQAPGSQKPQKHLIDATPDVMPRHARFGSGGSAPDVGAGLTGRGSPGRARSPARLQQPADPDETLNAAIRSVVRRSEQSAIKRAPRPPAGKENQAS